jgi:hypothetical protein
MAIVDIRSESEVLLLTVNNPPVNAIHRLHGEYWTPAPYLVRAAETGSWDAAHEVK